MKIAVFHSNDPTSGWNMGMGIIKTLRRMGHFVLEGPLPTAREASKPMIEMVKAGAPKVDALKTCDAIIVSGPEHISPWIDLVYGKYDWKHVPVPKACWLHESCNREDYTIDLDVLKWVGDEWFFPAIQDAEFHDQEPFVKGRSHWMPFGVDTEMFKPHGLVTMRGNSAEDARFEVQQAKCFDIAFLGLMYPKRQLFLRSLSNHNHPPIRCGMCSVSDLHGYHLEDSIRLLVSNTRQIKVFFNLPALSQLLVSKIYETMACGTFLLTPMLPENRGAERNMEPLKSGVHLVYYSPTNIPYVAQLLREWVSDDRDQERARIAQAGCEEVHKNHSLMRRLAELLLAVRVNTVAKQPERGCAQA
jgi:glycosyltransferase involved in cell wall biosynthesis